MAEDLPEALVHPVKAPIRLKKPSETRSDSCNHLEMSERIPSTTLVPAPHLRLRLLEPELHVHLAVQRRRDGEVFVRLLALAGPQVEFAEAKTAVGDEGPHAARLGQHQRVTVMGLSALGIESVGMARDVAEQVQRMGFVAVPKRRICDRAFAQTLRLVEPVE